MKADAYFKQVVLRKRPYLKIEWCQRVVSNPVSREIQPDGRIRLWGRIEEMKGDVKYLRVVLLSDGETIHNAFPDRDFAAGASESEDSEP
jgi:hypothetical protein